MEFRFLPTSQGSQYFEYLPPICISQGCINKAVPRSSAVLKREKIINTTRKEISLSVFVRDGNFPIHEAGTLTLYIGYNSGASKFQSPM